MRNLISSFWPVLTLILIFSNAEGLIFSNAEGLIFSNSKTPKGLFSQEGIQNIMNKHWTPYQEEVIKQYYLEMTDEELVNKIRDMTGTIYNIGEIKKKRQRLGLIKKKRTK